MTPRLFEIVRGVATQRHYRDRAIRAVAGRRGSPSVDYLANLFGVSRECILAALEGEG